MTTTATLAEITADPTDDDFPQGTCSDCRRPVIHVHGMWIATDGDAWCTGTIHGAHHSR